MDSQHIEYKIGTAEKIEIQQHLELCAVNFIPNLNKKVDIGSYSKKIFENSVTFEAWHVEILVGLVAAYINDINTMVGYITSVSVDKKYMGRGIAGKLLDMCIKYAKKNGFKNIELEVDQNNVTAYNLYRKIDFFDFKKYENIIKMKLHIK